MIDIEGLSKRYSKEEARRPALSDLSLAVNEGETVALIGANGAGKSTLIKILSTLLRPDSGRAAVAGMDVVRRAAEVRKAIGITLQDVSLYPSGRVLKVLNLHAQLHGLDRVETSRRSNEIVTLMDLGQVADRKVHHLSGGMRRRLDLGLALIHQPPVLLLDEPTTSLDPISRAAFWDELDRLRSEGTCLLVATQSIEEAERLADRIVTLTNGAVGSGDTPAATINEFSSPVHAG